MNENYEQALENTGELFLRNRSKQPNHENIPI